MIATSAPPPVESKLTEARLRLAYINQNRELALGVLLGLALALRVLGIPLAASALVLLAAWFSLAVAFVRLGGRAHSRASLHRLAFLYFVAELLLITLLANIAGAAIWLALLFFVVTILYAHMMLPYPAALTITALAVLCFTALVAIEWRHWVGSPAAALFAAERFSRPGYFAFTLIAGALAGYLLIGLTLSRFSRILNSQAEALQAANRDLFAQSHELQLHRHHLEDLVQQRTSDLRLATEELQRANQELRRLNELKSNFLANVSHELRTPLTSIRSFSEILLSYPDEDVFTRCEFLEIIIAESDRLTRLINDVLDLAKIEAGHMVWRPQPVQLADLARQSLEIFQVVASHKGIKLYNSVAAELPLVQADADRLRQVLTNLLSNALKFTAAGSIQIGSLAYPTEVVLYVADTGVGIAVTDLERIFEKFHQHGNALTDKPTGTGLGLSICREIMHYHGGRIWAESRQHQGSTFYCSLPALSPPTGRGAPVGSA